MLVTVMVLVDMVAITMVLPVLEVHLREALEVTKAEVSSKALVDMAQETMV